MDDPTVGACGLCRFWDASPDFDADGFEVAPISKQCLRFPPQVVMKQSLGRLLPMTIFPQTFSGDRCGEFQPIDRPAEKTESPDVQD